MADMAFLLAVKTLALRALSSSVVWRMAYATLSFHSGIGYVNFDRAYEDGRGYCVTSDVCKKACLLEFIFNAFNVERMYMLV